VLEEVYMRQPPGYADKSQLNFVCKLDKSSLWSQTSTTCLVCSFVWKT
jgi:hypothetical protein